MTQIHFIQNRWRPALLIAALFLSTPLFADSISVSLIPASGNISGAPGSTIGWGYSITNNSATDWFLATNLNADTFSHGTPNNIFDFPEVAPGTTVMEPLDTVNLFGLYELTWDANAPNNFVNSGNFTLSGAWYDGDPFNGGNFINNAPDTLLAYSATVTSTGPSTPEPASWVLFGCGFGLLAAIRARRRGAV